MLDFTLENYCDDNFSRARIFASKGAILEKYREDFSEANNYYNKWADLKTILAGHEMDRLRSLLRSNSLKPTHEFITLFRALTKDISDLPTKNFRFWMSVFSAVAYSFESYFADTKRMAAKALIVYHENAPTLLQRAFKKLSSVDDAIMITDKEIKILEKLSKSGIV